MKKSISANKLFLSTILALALAHGPAFSEKKENLDQVQSHRFFAFEDAEYHTSPDKRIGAKILVDPAKVGPSISSMVHLTYLPGAHIKSHRHVYVTEIVHVIEGNLTLRIGDEIKVMGANSTAWIPPKAFHEYLNDSTDVVKFIQYFAPSGPEEEYRNWTKPSAEPLSAASPTAANASPTNIVSPPLPPIPGSPKPKLGSVVEKPADSAANDVPDLKFKAEPGSK
ncbi:MAG: cupin domain-containing protein [Candidatus Riflebacteria bacterium]